MNSKILGYLFLSYSIGTLALVFVLHSSLHASETQSSTELRLLTTNQYLSQPLNSSSTANIPDFKKITDIKQRKVQFFNFLLPLIQKQNSIISKQRAALIKINEDIKNLQPVDISPLLPLADYYKVRSRAPSKLLNDLLMKVDEIPASMILAQAANESAWGTSRFATKANNYFGQWCFSKGCGLVPKHRTKGANHEVKKFKSANESVVSYFRNLNTHKSYQEFRKIRAKLRKENKPLVGLVLVKGLVLYSSRGEDYVHELQKMIKYNKLQQFPNR
jgi:Bax protein